MAASAEQKKAAPSLGPLIQRGRKAGMSGKTIQGAVLATSTANRELSRTLLEESEGHFSVCGLFCTIEKCTCPTKGRDHNEV